MVHNRSLNRLPLNPKLASNSLYAITTTPTRALCSNTPSSPKEIEPSLRKKSSLQKIINNPNSTPKDPLQGPQDDPGHPILENPNFEKSVHNIKKTSYIDIKTMNPIPEHPNHPTTIFPEFMDKGWGEVQTEGGKGVHSEGVIRSLPVT